MEQAIRINYFNPVLKIGLTSWREAWLLSGKYPEKLIRSYTDANWFLESAEPTNASVISS